MAEHFRQLCANGFVPVINGHVEAIVAVRPAIGLTVPELQSVLKAFTLIGTGKVNDGGGAAPQRRTAAESKIIRCSGAADVQIKVGMRVNKAGEQETALHILNAIGLSPNEAANLLDTAVFQKNIGPSGTPGGNNGAALQQCSHSIPSFRI